MAHYTGWFPTRRDDVIHMADDWEAQLDAKGAAWGVSAAQIAEFKSQKAAAAAMLAEVKSGNRTKVNTEQCRLLFHELSLTMHFLKNNFFNSPPRTNDELVSLLLPVHDGTPTPIAPCDVVPGITLHNTDGHGMLVKLFADAEPSDTRSADHFFCKWGVKPAGRWATQEEAAADGRLLTRQPARADDLPQHFSSGRQKNSLPFNLADIGMEFFTSACWQTPRNQDCPYCPIVSRIIA
jgi:hypothetical protein